ncbi:MAG: uL15m family ribosomal protein [Clostridia bacterium]|nr:uL15m family ribosomal protein [Clostridia bacterium]
MIRTNKRKILPWLIVAIFTFVLSVVALLWSNVLTLKSNADQTSNTVTLGEGVLYVGGEDIVKAANYTVNGNVGGTAVLSETNGNRILTLTDYAYEGPGYTGSYEGGGIDYRGDGNLTIILNGESSIVKKNDNSIDLSHGIYFCSEEASLIVDGTGSLTISFDSERSGGKSNGIFCEPGAFVMNGGTVVSNAGTGDESAGIYTDEGITFNGGSFTGNGYYTTAYESRGIYSSHITVNGGTVNATAPIDNGNEARAFDNSTVIINNGEVTAYGKTAFNYTSGVVFGAQTTFTIMAGNTPQSATQANNIQSVRYIHISAQEKNNYVASVGETQYESLLEAYEGASENDVIVLLTDIDVSEESNYILIKKPITFDINGHVLNIGAQKAIVVGDSQTSVVLTVKNSVPEEGGMLGSCIVSEGGSYILFYDARLEFTKAQLEATSDINKIAAGYHISDIQSTDPSYAQGFRSLIGPHSHDGITFTAWESTTSLPTSAGNYCLTADVTISSTWNVPSGTTNLCLNGYGITMTGNDSVVYVASGNTLNIYDEEDSDVIHYFNVDSYSCAININDNSGSNSFTGGYIAGGKGRDLLHGGGVFINGGVFNLYGGNILGNRVTASDNCGAGVFLNDNSTFRMYGGSISYNYAQNAGCAIFGWRNSTIEIYGGEISYNKTTWSHGSAISFWNQSGYTVSLKWYGGEIHDNLTGSGGGAVNFSESSLTVGMKGNPTVWDNATSSTNSNATLNVYVGSKPINIEGALTNTKKIGLRLASGTGVFTNGWSDNMGDANPADYFYSENENYSVYLQDGEAVILDESTLEHAHDGIIFEAWNESGSLPSTAGNYYLTADVTLSGYWTVPSGTTNLCLNGFGIKTTNDRVIYINGGTLNLYDCGDATHYFDVNESNMAVNVNDESGTHSFTGGYITGGQGTSNGCSQTSYYLYEGGGVLVWSGTFNMHGGTILGNRAGEGAGVEVVNATMNMYGGSIIYNSVNSNFSSCGGGINLRSQSNNSAILNMYGGNICYNRGVGVAADYCYGSKEFNLYGGSISYNTTRGVWVAPLNINGSPIIEGNGAYGTYVARSTSFNGVPVIRNNGSGDLYIPQNSTIKITDTWNSDMMSVVMASKTGIFTSGWSDYMGDADPADYFYSYDEAYTVSLQDGEAVLIENNDFKLTIKITSKSTIPSDYEEYIADGEKIVRVYDVTLYRIDIIGDDEQEPVSVQPSDFDSDLTLTVKLTIPSVLIGKNFRILHVHAADDYEFVTFTTDDDGKHIRISGIDRLSDFAFVALKSDLTPDDQGGGQGGEEGQGEVPTIEPEQEITKEDDPTIDNWDITPQDGTDPGGQGEGGSSQEGNTPAVTVVIEDTAPQSDVSVEIELKTEISEEVQEVQNSVLNTVIQEGDEIAVVYDVKLIRKTIENGVEIREEIQPSDIKAGTIVAISMTIPETLRGKTFRLLHIHSNQDVKEMSYTVSEDGTIATVRVDRLSEFAFVGKVVAEGDEPNKISDGAIVGIVVGGSLILLSLGLLIFFLLKRRDKEDPDENEVVNVATVPVVSTTGEPVALGQSASYENESDVTALDSDEAADDGIVVYSKGNYFNIRYNKSFTAKLIQSSDETKGYYGELKNEVLSYTKTKSHVSWSYDSVNAGRKHVVKFSIRGKTLCIYFPMNAEDLDEKYKVEKVEAAKYAAVPCLYRIKNERRLRYAKELIEKVCLSIGLTKGEAKNEEYYLPYETNEPLINRGLIKELTVKATDTQIEKAKKEGSIRVVDNVSASDVNAMISNEVALSSIIKTEQHATGKKGIINVDTLSMNFNDGDTVTVQSLKEKKLIANDVKQVKLLARGNLNKALHIELQDYSIEAVKMILATGGTVKRC